MTGHLNVGFAVDNVALGQVPLQAALYLTVSIILIILHTDSFIHSVHLMLWPTLYILSVERVFYLTQ
jgi:hypothetical protein